MFSASETAHSTKAAESSKAATRARAVAQPPTYPSGLTWAHVAFMHGLLESDRRFTELEWRTFVGAYRGELQEHAVTPPAVAAG